MLGKWRPDLSAGSGRLYVLAHRAASLLAFSYSYIYESESIGASNRRWIRCQRRRLIGSELLVQRRAERITPGADLVYRRVLFHAQELHAFGLRHRLAALRPPLRVGGRPVDGGGRVGRD